MAERRDGGGLRLDRRGSHVSIAPPPQYLLTRFGPVNNRPQRTTGLIGVSTLSRLRHRAQIKRTLDVSEERPTLTRRLSNAAAFVGVQLNNEFGFAQLEEDGDNDGAGAGSSQGKGTRQSKSKRRSVLLERNLKEVIEEENRRRAAAYVADDKWDEATTSVWFPCGPKKQLWDSLILVVLLYTIWVEPFRIFTNTPSSGLWYGLDLTLSFFFMADILFTFNTAYLETSLEGDNWVIDRRMIAGHYVQNGRFFVELLSSYPAELVNLIAHQFGSNELPVFRLLRLLRLLRLARVVRELTDIYNEILLKLESRLQANLGVFQLVGPLAVLVYLMHVLACAFVGISTIAVAHGKEAAWLTHYDDGAAMAGIHTRYLIALYWASGTATGLGTGVIPMNEYEWAFVSGAHVIGVIVMGSVIGWIARSIESSQSPIEKEIERKTDIVKDITRWRAMPPTLADHVIRFYTHYSRKHAAAVLDDERELLESLAVAPSLRRDVLKHLLGKSVNLIPCFTRERASYASDEFQLAVDPLLHPVVFEPDDVIFEQGRKSTSKSKPHHQVFFLIDGTAKCCTTIAGRRRMLYTIREEGEMFGEHVLLGEGGIAADVSCIALSRCDVFQLSRDDLLELLKKFPDAVEEFATFVLEGHLRHKCSRYFSLRLALNESETLGKGEAGAALRIQLHTFRRQKAELRYAHPYDVMPLLFRSWSTANIESLTLAAAPPPSSAAPSAGQPASSEHASATANPTPPSRAPIGGRTSIGRTSAFAEPSVSFLAPAHKRRTVSIKDITSALQQKGAMPEQVGGRHSEISTPPPRRTPIISSTPPHAAPSAIDTRAIESKLEAHARSVDERLAALQSAIDANSIALSMLVKSAKEADARARAGAASYDA